MEILRTPRRSRLWSPKIKVSKEIEVTTDDDNFSSHSASRTSKLTMHRTYAHSEQCRPRSPLASRLMRKDLMISIESKSMEDPETTLMGIMRWSTSRCELGRTPNLCSFRPFALPQLFPSLSRSVPQTFAGSSISCKPFLFQVEEPFSTRIKKLSDGKHLDKAPCATRHPRVCSWRSCQRFNS